MGAGTRVTRLAAESAPVIDRLVIGSTPGWLCHQQVGPSESSRTGSVPTLAELTNRVLLAGAALSPCGRPRSSLVRGRADRCRLQALLARARREEMEAETTRLAAPPYDALTGDERLALLTGLASLPG